MTEQDLVSIVMPTFDCEAYIVEAIKSVKAQTYMNWELLIVDDCSSDATESVVCKMIADDARIKYMRNPKRLGAAESRNKALSMARGRWIAFLDSDDLWFPDKLNSQIKFMTDHGYHFSYHKYYVIDEEGNSLNTIVGGMEKVGVFGMYSCCWPGCLTVIYDREFVGLVQVASIERNNDSAIWLDVVRKCPCYLLNMPLAYYRHRKGSLTPSSAWKKVLAHYPLFRVGAKMNPVMAWIMVGVNILGSIYKKVFYVKTVRELATT